MNKSLISVAVASLFLTMTAPAGAVDLGGTTGNSAGGDVAVGTGSAAASIPSTYDPTACGPGSGNGPCDPGTGLPDPWNVGPAPAATPALAVGAGSTAWGNNTLAVGGGLVGIGVVPGTLPTDPATQSVSDSIAIGAGSSAQSSQQTVIGSGTSAWAGADGATVVGSSAIGAGTYSTVLGATAVGGASSVSIGYSAGDRIANGDSQNVMIGDHSNVDGSNGPLFNNVAVGSGSRIDGPGTNNAVAIGAGSLASESGIVSFGNASNGLTRRLTNVSAGVAATDAVNKGQLDAAIAAIPASGGGGGGGGTVDTTARDAAQTAQTTADGAVSAAATATTAAGQAQTTATGAATTAGQALSTAQAAQTTANSAITAVSAAATADSKAATAQVTADNASAAAASATTVASTAQTAATAAATAAAAADGKAVVAQTAADKADAKAVFAQKSAEVADAKAATAQTTANSAVSAAAVADGKAVAAQTTATVVNNQVNAAALQLGQGAQALVAGGVAIGQGAKSDSGISIAIGAGSHAVSSVAIGVQAQAVGLNTLSAGDYSAAAGSRSVALGANSSTTAAATNSVALGSGSIATRASVVEVGGRQISGVAAPTAGTDAANREYVDQSIAAAAPDLTPLNQQISTLSGQINELGSEIKRVERTASGGAALAMAMANPVMLEPGERAVSAGMGMYNGQSAIALTGAYSIKRDPETVRKSSIKDIQISAGLGVATAGAAGMRVGVTLKF